MKTNPKDILIALLLWIGVLSQPMFQKLTSTGILKFIYQYVISPLMLMVLSRSGKFWVSKLIIITSVILSALVAYGINQLDYFSDEELDKSTSRYVFFNVIHLISFAIIFFVMGGLMPLYNPTNFNA